ncbi:MAG: hypothetical protein K2X82_04760 [Gemmataceae bacterium]|nr:hypothetical protein [Gemmataceae bacterium]
MVVSWLRCVVPFLTGYAGGWAGMFVVGYLWVRPAAERMKAEYPEGFVCGNVFLGPFLLGLAAGSAVGFWVGRRVCRRY